MDSAALFYSAEPQKSASEIYNALSEVSVIQRAAIMKSDRREVRYAEGEYYETVSAASGEMFDFYLPCMVSGRCFEAEDFTGEAGVCLVEKNFFQDNGLTRKPGEKLVIDGTEYTVAGIGRKFDSRGRIWIP